MPVSFILNALFFFAGLVFASVGWKGYINAQKLEALEKIEKAREEERKRNEQIVTKHASDLFQVLDHYRRNPVTVRLPQLPCEGGSTGPVDASAESVLFVVGGAKTGDRKATD